MMNNFITTYTGKHFDYENPDPDQICIEDIAHSLSLTVRGNGHVRTFFSVAQHCLMCAKEAEARHLSDRIILACLLHDASEAYMSDVPSPVKHTLPYYEEQEKALLDMIYTKFLGSPLDEAEAQAVDEIDHGLLIYDLDNLIEPQFGEFPPMAIQPDYTFRPFEEVEDEYRRFFYHYSHQDEPQTIYLDDVAEEIEASMGDWQSYLNIQTGEYVSVSTSDPSLRDVYIADGEGDDGEKNEEINENDIIDSDDYIALPSYADINENKIMKDYASSLDDDLKEDLFNALSTDHPFHRFKNVLAHYGLLNDYKDYRHQMILMMAKMWLDDHHIRYRTR